jgi:hypothetical protein
VSPGCALALISEAKMESMMLQPSSSMDSELEAGVDRMAPFLINEEDIIVFGQLKE